MTTRSQGRRTLAQVDAGTGPPEGELRISAAPRAPRDARLVRPTVVVVGLGPAGAELLPHRSVRAMGGARQCFLRTTRHPAAEAALQMLGAGANVTSFDDLYDEAATFDDVYDAIVERLAGAARGALADVVGAVPAAAAADETGGYVCYAVPGSPLVAERTVVSLRARADLDVEVVPALSFLDLVWERLGVDPVASSVRIVDAASFVVDAAGQPGPFVVAQCHDRFVLSQVKLAVDEWSGSAGVDPPDAVVLYHLGLPDEQVLAVSWHEIDQVVGPDHLTALWVPPWSSTVAVESARMEELVRVLRERCPWDRRQTHASLAPNLLEETYEVLEAITELDAEPDGADADAVGVVAEPDGADADAVGVGVDAEPDGADADAVGVVAEPGGAVDHLLEELGDVAFQVYFHARLAAESGWFTMADVLRAVHDKLVERHPHVFGDLTVASADEVAARWELSKQREKRRASIFDGIPTALPALAMAAKVQRRAEALRAAGARSAPELAATVAALASSAAGFRLPDPHGSRPSPVGSDPHRGHPSPVGSDPHGGQPSPVGSGPSAEQLVGSGPSAEQLVGRLLFAAVDLARLLEVDAETALRITVDEFRRQVDRGR